MFSSPVLLANRSASWRSASDSRMVTRLLRFLSLMSSVVCLCILFVKRKSRIIFWTVVLRGRFGSGSLPGGHFAASLASNCFSRYVMSSHEWAMKSASARGLCDPVQYADGTCATGPPIETKPEPRSRRFAADLTITPGCSPPHHPSILPSDFHGHGVAARILDRICSIRFVPTVASRQRAASSEAV